MIIALAIVCAVAVGAYCAYEAVTTAQAAAICENASNGLRARDVHAATPEVLRDAAFSLTLQALAWVAGALLAGLAAGVVIGVLL